MSTLGKRNIHFFLIFLTTLFLFSQEEAAAFKTFKKNPALKKALAVKLYRQSVWQRLLHYRSQNGQMLSDIDDKTFFLAKKGQSNPRQELIATILSFQNTAAHSQPTYCRYPARLDWLIKQKIFPAQEFPLEKCEKLQQWKKQLKIDSIALVFADYYPNHPASMFGHLFLLLKQKRFQKAPLLNYTVNFSADITEETDTIPQYLYKGLSGGYQSYYQIIPYDQIVTLYNNLEHRNLWEFELHLTKAQIHRLQLHLWELQTIPFTYYFLKKNCSYRIFQLLKLIDTELPDPPSASFWHLPVEALQSIEKNPRRYQKTIFRPSLLTQLQNKLKFLTQKEQDFLADLLENPTLLNTTTWTKTSPERRQLILNAAIAALRYRREPNYSSTANIIYRERARQLYRFPEPSAKTNLVSPVSAHAPRTIFLKRGQTTDKNFFEIGFQPLLHNELSLTGGYLPYSQLELLQTTLRRYDQTKKLHLRDFVLFHVRSLPAYSEFYPTLAWDSELRYQNRQETVEEKTGIHFHLGLGGALDFSGGRLAALATLQFISATQERKGGIQPALRWHYQTGEAYPVKMLLEGSIFALEPRYNEIRWDFSYALQKNFELRWGSQDSYQHLEHHLALWWHF